MLAIQKTKVSDLKFKSKVTNTDGRNYKLKLAIGPLSPEQLSVVHSGRESTRDLVIY